MKEGKNQQSSTALLTVLGILGRFLPHPPNFTPVGGAALFGGSTLTRPLNYLLPIGVMLVTDIFLGFHATMPYVYASFLLIAWLGERFLRNETNLSKVAAVSLTGSLLFFIITNFGVWLQGGLYPQTLAGLVSCYMMAIPFFKLTIAGDLVYSLGFFGLYAWAQNRSFLVQFDKKLTAWLS